MDYQLEYWHSYYKDGIPATICGSRTQAEEYLNMMGGFLFTRRVGPLLPYDNKTVEGDRVNV